jgi:RNA polymerase sigma-70 factor, ECF subfamily
MGATCDRGCGIICGRWCARRAVCGNCGRWRASNRVQIGVNRRAYETDVTDAELVQQAQRGSAAAFGELVLRYQDRIFNTCYRMCRQHADALDLTQTAFVRALEALPRFRGGSGFYTWLFRIAINVTMTHRRTAGRRAVRALDGRADEEGDAPAMAVTSCDCGVERPVEEDELQQRVADALARLDEEFRAAVVLKDIEGMDYAEIAEVLQVPVGTVKSRIHRGRMVLRELLCDQRTALDRT